MVGRILTALAAVALVVGFFGWAFGFWAGKGVAVVIACAAAWLLNQAIDKWFDDAAKREADREARDEEMLRLLREIRERLR